MFRSPLAVLKLALLRAVARLEAGKSKGRGAFRDARDDAMH